MLSSMTPADRVFQKFGGAERVARALGLTVARVNRWLYPKDRGGTNGRIPAKHQQKLLDIARAKGIDLKPDDFFNGG